MYGENIIYYNILLYKNELLKGNHPIFFEGIKAYFDEEKLAEIQNGKCGVFLIQNEQRGRQTIIYEYYQTDDVKWYPKYREWDKLTSIGLVKKSIIENNTTVIECRYYISSLEPDIELFSRAIRLHWSVEGKLHFHLDFTFKQDNNQTANKNALLNLQVTKKFALSLLNKAKNVLKEKKGYKYESINGMRLRISFNVEEEFKKLFDILS